MKNNLINYNNNPSVNFSAPLSLYQKNLVVGIDMVVDLYAFFASLKDVRCNAESVMLNKKLDINIVLKGIPNPTMNGVFPSMRPEDLNFLLGNSPKIISTTVYRNNDNLPSVELKWDFPKKNHSRDNIERYEIFRSATAKVDNTSARVAYITDGRVSSFIDDTIDGRLDSYYYRIYTYYFFVDGSRATTYSNVGQALVVNGSE